jgi:hypothetical protein
MKQLLFAFFLFLLSDFSFSQDTIVKINGEVVLAKISEINPNEIKYKKFSFQDGPTYIENKKGIRYIRFANGLREDFEAKPQTIISNSSIPPETNSNADYYDPNAGRAVNSELKMRPIGSKYWYNGKKIGEREMQTILMKTQNRDIIKHVQTAKDSKWLQYIGFGAIPLGIGAIYFLGSSVNYNGSINQGYLATSGIMLVGAIACPIVSGVFKHKRTLNNRKAVELYNQKY